jgi:hypothetical protein
VKPELALSYDAAIHPIAGKCTACGEQMPPPPTDPRDNVDAVLWLSGSFLQHAQLKHSVRSGSDEPEDLL